MHSNQPLWKPSAERVAASNMSAFMRAVHSRYNVNADDYAHLHRWSVEQLEDFWSALWDFTGVVAESRGERVLSDGDKMPGARFFPDARLNFAENLLRHKGDGDAIVFWGENRVRHRLTQKQLHDDVSRVAQALRAMGVVAGDRVSAFMPNVPETVVAALATASIGAVWTSCSADFGARGVIDRFGQVLPKVLFACDGYYYNGKTYDSHDVVKEISAALPSLERVVIVPTLREEAGVTGISDAMSLADFVAPFKPGPIQFEQMPFNHPLYIAYSSGTTGAPKCIVHGAGGTLLMHLKEHQLHCDIKPGDRLFYYTTCGWMMWNWLISGLASGATLYLYEGSPFLSRGNILWDFAEQERITHFGTSAKFLDAIAKIRVRPKQTHDLSALRMILSTGSPLAPEGFDYVYERVKDDVCLASISGGTDIIACFIGGCPVRPVWRGELQCALLGMKVGVFDENGKSLRGAAEGKGKGELVCTAPFPSMPIGFWNDPEDKKYRAAYFEKFPGVWHHGDWCEITKHGGMIIYGRSDAVLNPGGVRIGTAEIYRQVEKLEEVMESIVIGQDWPPGKAGDVRVVLFVRLADGLSLSDSLVRKIKDVVRVNTTPRHVPDKVLQVADIPRTKSGKIVELAVRAIVHGGAVKNVEALANPEALELFRDREELKA
jgi:acetoacetyl-CoA synthetase